MNKSKAETETEWDREIELFWGIGSHDNGAWKVQNPHGKLTENRYCNLETQFHRTDQAAWKLRQNFYVLVLRLSSFFVCMSAKSLQSCSILCDAMNCSPPTSSVHGILQARIMEWVTMPSSRTSSVLKGRTHISYKSCIGRWVLYH